MSLSVNFLVCKIDTVLHEYYKGRHHPKLPNTIFSTISGKHCCILDISTP